MNTTCIRIEGGLLSPDLTERLYGLEGQKPSDFGLEARRALVDEISSVWADVQTYWKAFERRRAHAANESITTITREQWVQPLLETLGYRLTFKRAATDVDGRSFVINYWAGEPGIAPPVHIVGYDLELGNRPPAGRGTLSPHGLVQDYLNRTEHLWGVVTNGMILRLLRDSSLFTRPAYIEFDLKQMVEGGRLDEFILFYRLAHRTRLPQGTEDATQCWLERYHQTTIEQGGRIRDGLRDAVEKAIVTLANGFLQHGANHTLRDKIGKGTLSPKEFYRQLLYLIYRLLFLMVAEERHLLIAPGQMANGLDAIQFYYENLSLFRLRALAQEPLTAPGRFDDLHLGLRTLFYVLADEPAAGQLGLPVLNGELFHHLPDLDEARLSNEAVLQAISQISYFVPSEERVRRRVNYAALDVEELGSVYTSLLEFEPVFHQSGGTLEFAFAPGTERRSTGSFYTAPQLVGELIQNALIPVLQERLKSAKTQDEKKQAILSMQVLDIASGSGHFLLAAARTLGRELAKVETGADEPSPEAIRLAVREVIAHCIYGVDKNPLAVDLCKVALWIEGHAEGKPLTFLDARIRCGDSLVGVTDLSVLQEGIPDEAFDAVAGDERALSTQIKRRNRQERSGQLGLAFNASVELTDRANERQALLGIPDDTPELIRRKQQAYDELCKSSQVERTACNLWTAAFFAPLTRENLENNRIPTTDTLRSFLNGNADARFAAAANDLAERYRFFHWALVSVVQ